MNSYSSITGKLLLATAVLAVTACAEPNVRELAQRPYAPEILIFAAGQGTTEAEHCRNVLVRDQILPGYQPHRGGCLKTGFADRNAAVREFEHLVADLKFPGEIVMDRATVLVEAYWTEPTSTTSTSTQPWQFWEPNPRVVPYFPAPKITSKTVHHPAEWNWSVSASDATGEISYHSASGWPPPSLHGALIEAFDTLNWARYRR